MAPNHLSASMTAHLCSLHLYVEWSVYKKGPRRFKPGAVCLYAIIFLRKYAFKHSVLRACSILERYRLRFRNKRYGFPKHPRYQHVDLQGLPCRKLGCAVLFLRSICYSPFGGENLFGFSSRLFFLYAEFRLSHPLSRSSHLVVHAAFACALSACRLSKSIREDLDCASSLRSFQVSMVKHHAVCGWQLRSANTGIFP